jgi:hypothetical protein
MNEALDIIFRTAVQNANALVAEAIAEIGETDG